MRLAWNFGAVSVAILFGGAFGSAAETASRWWEPYDGTEANGPQVLGFWRFDAEIDLTADRSSHAHAGTLRGGKWNAEGKFGGCLESSAGYPIEDASHSIHAKRSPVLSPGGPFTLEMWVRPKPADEFPPEVTPILADMKYIPGDHTGFLWAMTKGSGEGLRRFSIEIGLGARSERWYSLPFQLTPGQWRHIAFTYDGMGTVAFFVDGGEVGRSTKSGAGSMAAAVRDLAIGDRIGSLYRGFPGWIDEVRFTSGLREFRPIRLDSDSKRPVFRRMSDAGKIRTTLRNLTDGSLDSVNVRVDLPGAMGQAFAIPELKADEIYPLEIDVDTAVRPGEYEARVTIEDPDWGGDPAGYRAETRIPFVVVPRPLPDRMPVVMWGLGGNEGIIKEIPRLKDLGFTHCLGLRTNFQRIWDEGESALPGDPIDIRAGRDMLDVALANDIGIVAGVAPARWLRTAVVGKPFLRIDRKGTHYGREDVSGLFEPVQDLCFNTGAALARAYGDHPAFAAALLHTEVRGESQVSFHPIEIDAARKAIGGKVPAAVTIKNGVDYKKLPDFPENRVIADDDPILKYLSWFWREGDGWNALNTRLHEGLKSGISRDDFWTFHDPAVRVPSIGGSGGAADVLSHWTYSYPDPVRIGLCADELFEMARAGGRNQQVMKMTQLIWYRSQTAPLNAAPDAETSPWVDQDPDAAYITIAPMHLREAFWWKLSRPIKGIMYHGWNSLVENDSPSAYRFTNPNTAGELRRLTHEVVEPLGPTLLQVSDPPSDVAFLESFTSQMFARRGTYGWNHTWAGDLYHILMYAQLQPRVLYEETLLKEGLDGTKVLVMGDCDVLTESVVKAVSAFQEAGGVVVGDEELCPAIRPDLVVPRYKRTKDAAADWSHFQEQALSLRLFLHGKYTWPVESEHRAVVTRRRVFGESEYLFAVNDRREFGTYVGGYGLVMENGLPSGTKIVAHCDGKHVYDLVGRREIASTRKDSFLEIPLKLGPCEGKILMVTDRPIRQIELESPKSVQPGGSAKIDLAITDGTDPIDAVIPVYFQIIDPEGVEAEWSGYYGAAGGQLTVSLDIAPNDLPGLWEIRATELASGISETAYLRVKSGIQRE